MLTSTTQVLAPEAVVTVITDPEELDITSKSLSSNDELRNKLLLIQSTVHELQSSCRIRSEIINILPI